MSKPTGMRAFLTLWFGQLVSLFGSSMTQFALTIWAYEKTKSATALALVTFFSFGPAIILSPITGALVDRWNRKLMMMLSDIAGCVTTGAIFLLYASGHLEIWHLYLTGAIVGIFSTFQWPAYSAAITTMLPKDQYARASGMLGLADSASSVFAPVLAAALLALFTIGDVMLIDALSFVFAIATLIFIHVPQPEKTETGAASKGNLWQESLYGFRYILQRPSLLALQLSFFCINLTGAFTISLIAPLVLARSNNNDGVLATVQSLGAVGGVIGGLLLSTWGGPKRKIHGVLIGMIGASLLGQGILGLGTTLVAWSVGSFARALFLPILNGSNQAIWQSKVAPDVQGRVFAARRMIAQATIPLSLLIAGPLADRVFEPAMAAGGALAPIFGGLVGTGAGAGMSLMFLLFGVFGGLVGLFGFLSPRIRNVEDTLPDHETAAPRVSSEAVPREAFSIEDVFVDNIDDQRVEDETATALPSVETEPVNVVVVTAVAPTRQPDAMAAEADIQTLIQRLGEDSPVRLQAIEQLRASDHDISWAVLRQIASTNALIRAGCASVLGRYRSEDVTNILMHLLSDQDVRTRVSAAKSLGEIGDKAAVPALLLATHDRSELVRRAAISALREVRAKPTASKESRTSDPSRAAL